MDAMVTARMPQGKKDAGNAVLKGMGLTPSQVINELYDELIAGNGIPFGSCAEVKRTHTREELAQAHDWAVGLSASATGGFEDAGKHDIRSARLRSRGLMDTGEAFL